MTTIAQQPLRLSRAHTFPQEGASSELSTVVRTSPQSCSPHYRPILPQHNRMPCMLRLSASPLKLGPRFLARGHPEWERRWIARERAARGSKVHRWPPLVNDPLGSRMGVRIRYDWLGNEIRVYTREEVARHNKVGDAWLVVDLKVFDASSWVHHHPGGINAIMTRAGGPKSSKEAKDASLDFEFHSENARRLWRKLEIGELEPDPSKGSCVIL